MGETPERAPNCLRCIHFYVTWDPAFPRGCRQFEIICRAMPCQEVYAATGRHCPSFENKAGVR